MDANKDIYHNNNNTNSNSNINNKNSNTGNYMNQEQRAYSEHVPGFQLCLLFRSIFSLFRSINSVVDYKLLFFGYLQCRPKTEV